ncbi:MAG TPA: glycine zipper 2TM domain-containing protein [Burkholderiales bacterium]|nr:glycine zipper 2TM domain-containing protein [Burkholderiales bacterium]
METQAKKSLHPLMWVAGIALIVFCGAGVAAFMGWTTSSAGKPAEPSVVGKIDKPLTVERARAAPTTSARTPVAAICAECGVIQSVREIDGKGEGSGLGAAGGAVVGGLLGNQVGQGDGRKIATVIGAVGGAVAGNEIEKRVKTTKSYEITVRFDDGTSRVFTEANAPSWRNGDKVKVINGVIQSNA